MSLPHDTETRMPRVGAPYRQELQAPPRLLLYGVISLFILVIIGAIAGVLIFRDVLRPSQQQRVLEVAPFMRSFLAPTPIGGVLPTAVPGEDDATTARDLLNLSLPDAAVTPADMTSEAPDNTDPLAGGASQPADNTPAAESTSEEAVPVANTPTPTPEPSPTPAPSPTPTEPPATGGGTTDTSSAAVVSEPARTVAGMGLQLSSLPNSSRLYGLVWHQQTWNNCGPATLTTALSYFGWQRDQSYAGDILKPNREDKNVSPDELAQFVEEYTDLNALVRMGGNINTLRALLANEYPVIIERGMVFEAYDWLGHYQTLVAYDDTSQLFFAYDSFLGTGDGEGGIAQSYREVDSDWRTFNRTFIVIYPPQDENRIMEILGPLADEEQAATIAFEMAQQEADINPEDGFAWFNMGTSLVALERYQEAANAFALARRYELPWRMYWYQFGPFRAYYEAGRYDEVLTHAETILTQAEELEEAYYWRGRAYAARGETARAASEYRRALSYNPNFAAARQALDNMS